MGGFVGWENKYDIIAIGRATAVAVFRSARREREREKGKARNAPPVALQKSEQIRASLGGGERSC